MLTGISGLSGLSAVAGNTVTYLLLDQFTTADAAPIASPRTCEPGPGGLALTDANSVMGISGGRLVLSGTPAGNTDGWIGSASYARAAGLALFGRVVAATNSTTLGSGNGRLGWVSSNAINGTEAGSLCSQTTGDLQSAISTGNGPALLGVITSGFLCDQAVVLRGTGAFFLVRTPGENWKLAYPVNVGNAATVYPRYRLSANTYGISWDDVAVQQLTGPWSTDNGIATNRTASASANATLTHEANCVLEGTRTMAAAETWDILFRRTDDSNCWVVRTVQGAPGSITLYEKVAGVETSRATASITVTAASHRLVVTADGQKVRVILDNTHRLSYDSAATNLTATGAKTTQAITEFVSWPRTLSGTALEVLSTLYPFSNPSLGSAYADNSLAADTTTYNPATRLGTGGTDRAYKTLLGAVTAVTAGGTVYIRAGTYREKGQADICYPISKSLTLDCYNGEAVTLTYPVGSPPLAGTGEYGQIVKVSGSADVTFEGRKGLVIVGTHAEGDSASQDLDINLLLETTGTVSVRQVKFQGYGHASIKTSANYAGLTVEQCAFEAGGFTQRDHHVYEPKGGGTYRHNSFAGHAGYAIHVYDNVPRACAIYGNVVFSGGGTYAPVAGGGMLISTGAAHVVRNNTIYANNGYGGIVFWKDYGSGPSVTFESNILWGNAAAGAAADLVCDNAFITGSHNDIGTQVMGGAVLGTYTGTNDLSSDPLVATTPPDSFDDLRLQAGSPCVGAGVATSGVTLLDPAVTAWPTPKASSTAADAAGAFAPS